MDWEFRTGNVLAENAPDVLLLSKSCKSLESLRTVRTIRDVHVERHAFESFLRLGASQFMNFHHQAASI